MTAQICVQISVVPGGVVHFGPDLLTSRYARKGSSLLLRFVLYGKQLF